VVENLLAGLGIAFVVGVAAGIRKIIQLLQLINDHVVPHFRPELDQHGREDMTNTLPERVRKIEEEVSFDHGTSIKDVVGQIARANGIDAPEGPEHDA
jgi:hypothetical protein